MLTISQTGPGLLTKTICDFMCMPSTSNINQVKARTEKKWLHPDALIDSVTQEDYTDMQHISKSNITDIAFNTPSCADLLRDDENVSMEDCSDQIYTYDLWVKTMVIFPVDVFHPVPNHVSVDLEKEFSLKTADFGGLSDITKYSNLVKKQSDFKSSASEDITSSIEVCPESRNSRQSLLQKFVVPGVTRAVHWWQRSWQ